MADLLPVGIDSETGQLKMLEFGVDTMRSGTNDFAFSVYNGGDIDIGTSNDGAYVDVDATNAQITFSVTSPGRFILSFNFSSKFSSTSGSNVGSAVSFRLTDGTVNSAPTSVGADLAAGAAFTSTLTSAIALNTIFDFPTAGSKTVKLQKFNKTSSNLDSRLVLANGDTSIKMFAVRVAD